MAIPELEWDNGDAFCYRTRSTGEIERGGYYQDGDVRVWSEVMLDRYDTVRVMAREILRLREAFEKVASYVEDVMSPDDDPELFELLEAVPARRGNGGDDNG